MPIKIGDYTFEGPFESTTLINDEPGIFIVLDNLNNQFYPVDCGEAEQIKSTVKKHDRLTCWRSNINGDLQIAVLYMPKSEKKDRVNIEEELRAMLNFPCGYRQY